MKFSFITSISRLLSAIWQFFLIIIYFWAKFFETLALLIKKVIEALMSDKS